MGRISPSNARQGHASFAPGAHATYGESVWKIPLEDATTPLVVVIEQKHCQTGVPGNSAECTIAKGILDGTDALAVRVHNTRVEGVFPRGATGIQRLRYILSHADRMAIIEVLDTRKGSVIPRERTITLGVPSGSNTLEAIRAQSAKDRERKKQLIAGAPLAVPVPKKKVRRKKKAPKVYSHGLQGLIERRSGTGKVH